MPHDDLFKDHYFHELERRDSLNASLSFPVGLVTLLASSIYVMSARLSVPFDYWERTLSIFLALEVACLIGATYFLVRAYWGYTYLMMPLSGPLFAFKDQLLTHFTKLGKSEASSLASSHFYTELDKTYARTCETNSLNNDSKSSRIFRANSLIIGAISCAIVAMPAFAVLILKASHATPEVRIANLKDISLNTQNSEPAPKPTQQQTPAPEPVMPTMPPVREVKEHVEPKQK